MANRAGADDADANSVLSGCRPSCLRLQGWLALRNALKKSVRRAFDWESAMNQFAILYGDRFTLAKS
jgi:hypothetical protein